MTTGYRWCVCCDNWANWSENWKGKRFEIVKENRNCSAISINKMQCQFWWLWHDAKELIIMSFVNSLVSPKSQQNYIPIALNPNRGNNWLCHELCDKFFYPINKIRFSIVYSFSIDERINSSSLRMDCNFNNIYRFHTQFVWSICCIKLFITVKWVVFLSTNWLEKR